MEAFGNRRGKGNVKNASSLIEAAIGLLEMNGASDKSLKKYQERLEKLTLTK